MISQVNQAGVRAAYTKTLDEEKEVSKKTSTTVSQQGDTSKVERIKEALESGEYKINLQALSEKIAEELM
ncbi:MAG: flagellar biosynthesis anti-sigma factor FlgM [Sulfurimonas sp.]|uniref:flagellar biosynthesis anti-sigma factor FlgM n=1 Tax=Sulfurimonas sp. TaxID=2022749 RepID=UPI0028CDEBC2|nr:flagellar biosynthesis anti-sigma factor FlgM [Sulfurimonas sp.]MDT8338328.1 flagellar biosynthesis anti-sigma factor FlgM [Sulfurimonas sp.]